jgi:hypothetical protein
MSKVESKSKAQMEKVILSATAKLFAAVEHQKICLSATLHISNVNICKDSMNKPLFSTPSLKCMTTSNDPKMLLSLLLNTEITNVLIVEKLTTSLKIFKGN